MVPLLRWLPADESDFTSERTGAAAALWRVVYEDGPIEVSRELCGWRVRRIPRFLDRFGVTAIHTSRIARRNYHTPCVACHIECHTPCVVALCAARGGSHVKHK